MAIGWDELGDLSQYKSQTEINKELQTSYGTKTSKSNDAKACFDFYKNVKIGDSIIVKKDCMKFSVMVSSNLTTFMRILPMNSKIGEKYYGNITEYGLHQFLCRKNTNQKR